MYSPYILPNQAPVSYDAVTVEPDILAIVCAVSSAPISIKPKPKSTPREISSALRIEEIETIILKTKIKT